MPRYIVRHKKTGVTVKVYAVDALRAVQVYGWTPELCDVKLDEKVGAGE